MPWYLRASGDASAFGGRGEGEEGGAKSLIRTKLQSPARWQALVSPRHLRYRSLLRSRPAALSLPARAVCSLNVYEMALRLPVAAV